MYASHFDQSDPLITLTAASAGGQSADQDNRLHRGLMVFINITALTGTGPTLTVTVQGRDRVSGQYFNFLSSTALSAVAFTRLLVYPGVTATANFSDNDVLSPTWRILYAIGGTTPAVTGTISFAKMV